MSNNTKNGLRLVHSAQPEEERRQSERSKREHMIGSVVTKSMVALTVVAISAGTLKNALFGSAAPSPQDQAAALVEKMHKVPETATVPGEGNDQLVIDANPGIKSNPTLDNAMVSYVNNENNGSAGFDQTYSVPKATPAEIHSQP